MISDMLQPKVSAGHVRISWTCRCGDRLRLEVHESRLQAATAFVKQAAGSNAGTVTTRRRIEGSSASASSSSQASTSTDAPAANSPSSGPHSPDTSPSDEEAETVTPPFIPTGAKKYLLLCVNTASLHGIGQRKLVNVDVTNIEDDGELFQALRNAYTTLSQTSWNPFLIPKTMHYVKFQLIFLQKSGELVGHYEVDSIPSLKQVSKQEYAFWPCPPDMGELPISPDLFMHAFLDPGNHMGTLAVQRLPKKLWAELRWNGQVHGHFNIPTGWGIYIVEGVYWALVWWWTILALVAVTILTVAWSALMDDVQGGTGLGQYCLAALAGLGSVCLWHYNARET
ncbi:hypothetical protein QBC40DRAFT_205206 [Triangularia verruculosa]|uniref:Uncharacterized protein n=1 Tax=Triangularia verruculosa TaxID=2587418 RepID=A0AAN6XCV6_9PEZI|nr:hypothetical protein QBC40DRAFT_205206 [Triangularia verruculosa]